MYKEEKKVEFKCITLEREELSLARERILKGDKTRDCSCTDFLSLHQLFITKEKKMFCFTKFPLLRHFSKKPLSKITIMQLCKMLLVENFVFFSTIEQFTRLRGFTSLLYCFHLYSLVGLPINLEQLASGGCTEDEQEQ